VPEGRRRPSCTSGLRRPGSNAVQGLAGDGLGDNAYLIIDGVDARVHYVELSASHDKARIECVAELLDLRLQPGFPLD
jgi:hypothetical protein